MKRKSKYKNLKKIYFYFSLGFAIVAFLSYMLGCLLGQILLGIIASGILILIALRFYEYNMK